MYLRKDPDRSKRDQRTDKIFQESGTVQNLKNHSK